MPHPAWCEIHQSAKVRLGYDHDPGPLVCELCLAHEESGDTACGRSRCWSTGQCQGLCDSGEPTHA